ncbi:DsbA family protein [Shewanella dokdonensis]|uniref:DsbA family protein n=1 Tax=Shewanella dokdonensis TaxID=712036 RepID=UPI0031403ED7
MEKTAQLLKGKVALVRTPVGAHRPAWILSQQAYYLAQKFKIVNQVHSKIFARIHEQHQPFSTEADLEAFFVEQGIDKTVLQKTIGSADAKLALENYEAQTQLAQIRGVPSLLVNGKYLIKASVSDAQALSELILYLANKPD